MNEVQEKTDSKQSESELDIVHYFCTICYPVPEEAQTGLCGTDLTDPKLAPDAADEDVCAMCADMMMDPCPRCGLKDF